MTDTKTEELAALYVLDLLKGDELKNFERRLEHETDLKQLVQELSTGLHAPMKNFNGPERMDLLEGIRDKIGIDPEKPVGKIHSMRWIQGLSVAATLLLALNLIQFFKAGSGSVVLEDELVKSRAAEKALVEENKTIKAFNKSWETEYMNLAQRMLPFVESRDGLGQFTVIDLVDVKGQGDFADGGKDGDISEYFLSRSPLKFASVKMTDIPESNPSVTVGYSVWKEDENRGYLDLYNLGESGPGRMPFLWVQSTSSDPYIPVGYLPSLDHGTGTFYFTVDQENFTPTSILITEESLNGPGQKPSPHHLMIGP